LQILSYEAFGVVCTLFYLGGGAAVRDSIIEHEDVSEQIAEEVVGV
jgi:hypothetical protein